MAFCQTSHQPRRFMYYSLFTRSKQKWLFWRAGFYPANQSNQKSFHKAPHQRLYLSSAIFLEWIWLAATECCSTSESGTICNQFKIDSPTFLRCANFRLNFDNYLKTILFL